MLITLVASLLAPSAPSALRTLAMLQAQDSINSGNSKLLMFFIGLVAVALVVQAVVVVTAGLASMKAWKEITAHLVELKAKAIPLLDKSHGLVVELTPQVREITSKVGVITTHIEAISGLAKDKANEISPTISAANQTVLAANETVKDANLKTRAQISRVNGMISSALDATVRLGVAIEQGIAKPGREVAGVVAGLKAGLETLISGARAFGSGGPVGRASTYSTTPKPGPVPVYKPAAEPAATVYPHSEK